MSSPDMFCGLTVTDVIIKENPTFSETKYFKLASPILLKQKTDNCNIIHITYKDEDVDKLLENSIKHKMRIANIPDDNTLKITVDKSSAECKTKFVKIHDIGNRCFYSPIQIEGRDITKKFIWNVGLGNSTGVGFGSLY
jgi:CRISPR-associated endoribonuclease Cas6